MSEKAWHRNKQEGNPSEVGKIQKRKKEEKDKPSKNTRPSPTSK